MQISLDQLTVLDVAPHLDIAEEAEARLERDPLERPRHRLDLRVIRCNPEAYEAPRSREALDHVDLDGNVGGEQGAGGIEAGRTGSDDCDSEGAHRR